MSVVVLAYNQEQFIRQCLGSLERQILTKYAFEVIVVDYTSTDMTFVKAQNHESSLSIKFKRLSKRSGPGPAPHEGIRLAESQYIIFVDGDDLLVSEALERLSKLWMKSNYDLNTYNWSCPSDLEGGEKIRPRRKGLMNTPEDKHAFISHYLKMN